MREVMSIGSDLAKSVISQLSRYTSVVTPAMDWLKHLQVGTTLVATRATSISGQLLLCTEKGFQGGLVFKARRLLYHSSLGRE